MRGVRRADHPTGPPARRRIAPPVLLARLPEPGALPPRRSPNRSAPADRPGGTARPPASTGRAAGAPAACRSLTPTNGPDGPRRPRARCAPRRSPNRPACKAADRPADTARPSAGTGRATAAAAACRSLTSTTRPARSRRRQRPAGRRRAPRSACPVPRQSSSLPASCASIPAAAASWRPSPATAAPRRGGPHPDRRLPRTWRPSPAGGSALAAVPRGCSAPPVGVVRLDPPARPGSSPPVGVVRLDPRGGPPAHPEAAQQLPAVAAQQRPGGPAAPRCGGPAAPRCGGPAAPRCGDPHPDRRLPRTWWPSLAAAAPRGDRRSASCASIPEAVPLPTPRRPSSALAAQQRPGGPEALVAIPAAGSSPR